jgi:hypothetical protein
LTDLLSKFADDFGKLVALRGSNPFKPDAFGRKAKKSKQVFHHCHSLGCDVVTFAIMAAPDMAAGYQDPICPFLEGL